MVEFFVNRGELLLGDIYTASVENILPGIDAAFVNLGKDKMGFLHANDVPGQGPLKKSVWYQSKSSWCKSPRSPPVTKDRSINGDKFAR
ncbi:MAG: hypothetical protein IPL73_15455 [Candidatus Obscuribacter sp.]|nr:hypothetical protein [Candidatus Obscuribacter sp.]